MDLITVKNVFKMMNIKLIHYLLIIHKNVKIQL